MTGFLVDAYGNSSTIVTIYEEDEPHYLIASSTGYPSAAVYRTDDPTIPCANDAIKSEDCEVVRVPVKDVQGWEQDDVVSAAYHMLEDTGYSQDLLIVKPYEEDLESVAWIVQSVSYERSGVNLKWRIVIASPAAESEADAILPGSSWFATLVSIATAGCVASLFFVAYIYRNREHRAVMYGDWRFTCAFSLGSALMNLSSLTLIGQNTNAMCLVRFWSFHLTFAITLSPLFIKVWRVKQLVNESRRFRLSLIHI